MSEVYTSLAVIEELRGNYIESLVYHNKALEVCLKHYSRKHPRTVQALTYIAKIHIINCEFADAGKLVQECITILTTYYGDIQPLHPAISDCYLLQATIHIILYELEPAENIIQTQLSHRIQRYGDRHPSVAQCLCYLADVYTIQLRLEDAHQLYNSALLIRKEILHENHIDIIMAQVGTAIIASKQNQYTIAMPIFEECLDNFKNILVSVEGRYHTNIATITLQYGLVAQRVGMINDSAVLYGKSGADQYSTFQSERHLRLADCLLHVANISKIQGRYKDAKYQYSVCMSIKYRYLGQTHPEVLEILYESADNMRSVGYFADASVAINALENLTIEKFGKNSHQLAVVNILQAHVLCDKGLALKAEVLYKEALNIIHEKFGDVNIYSLEIKIGLARCLHQQLNLADAEKLYKDCLLLSRQILGNDNHTTIDIISNLAMTKLSRKPDAVQSALNIMKEQVQPFYMNSYGANHPYTVHTSGRVGLLMNSLKKESGRRLVLKALKYFDEYKQFQFTHDHPWILELGGFIKRSSQERLSQSIEVQALAAWCMPRFEGDVNYGTMPKHFWVDLANNAAEAWGEVHYYGLEQEPSAAPLPLFQSAKEGRDGSPDRESRASTAAGRPRSRSPTATRSGVSTTADLESGEGGGDLAAALVAEQRARQDAEDLLENELASRRSMEEQLEQEQAARREIDEKLAVEIEERRKLEALFQESLAKISQLGLGTATAAADVAGEGSNPVTEGGGSAVAVPAAAVDTDKKEEKEGEEQTAPGAAAEGSVIDDPTDQSEKLPGTDIAAGSSAAANTAEEDEEVDLADLAGAEGEGLVGDQIALSSDPTAALTAEEAQASREAAEARTKADLEAAVFLFTRASSLQQDGWYRKAQPLFEECLRIRQQYLSNDPLTVTTMSAVARNHCLLHEWGSAEDMIAPTMKLAEKLCKLESEHFAEALLVKAETLLCKGQLADAVKTLNKSTKLIGKLVERCPTANKLLGRSACLQALANVRYGKIPEGKALTDRAAAILSKAYGINHIAVVEATHAKCEILLRTCKYKEAVAQVEQAYTIRRRLLGELHPASADCLLFMGIALVGIGKLTEGQVKFNQAREIRLEYFGENSLEYAEVLHYEAQLCVTLCEYQEALRKHVEVLRIRSMNVSDSHPTLSDTQHALGVLYSLLGQYSDADKHLALAMDIRSALAVAPSFHPLAAQTRCAQGELLRLQGEYDAARVLIEQSLEEHKVLFGKENADYLHVQQCFGLLLRDQGDLENADKVNKRTVKYRRQLLGLDHPALASSLLHQIDVLIDLGQTAEAQIMLTEARAILNLHYSDCAAHTEVIRAELTQAMVQLRIFEKQREEGEVAAEATAETAPAEATSSAAPLVEDKEETPLAESSSSADVIPEEIPTPVPAAAEPAEDPVPIFPNAEYIHTLDTLRSGIAQLQSVYQINARKLRSTLSAKKPKSDALAALRSSNSDGSSNMSPAQHPYVLYLQGCVGNVMLLEHLAKQRFAESLTAEDRERFNNRESYLRLQSREVQTKPPGLSELETAVTALSQYTAATATRYLHEEHCYIQKLKTAISNVVFVLDDMAVAANTFIEANTLHSKGRFAEADEKYNDVFIAQMTVLGAEQASNSLVIAETLYAKALNCCYLGEMEFSQFLFNQSIVIFRKQQGSDSEGVLKGFLGLTSILSWQGLYEEAYSMHTRVLAVYIQKFTENSEIAARLKIDIANDLFKLGKYDKAVRLAKEALHSLSHLSSPCPYEHLVAVRLLLAHVYLAQGDFPHSREHIDFVQNLLEGQTADAEHHPAAVHTPAAATTALAANPPPAKDDMLLALCSLLECKAEFLLVHSKFFEAQKSITRAFKMKIKALGRTNRIAEGNRNSDRKMAFFDSLDHLTNEFKVKNRSHSDDEEEPGGAGRGSGGGGGKRVIALNRGNRQEEADQQLDQEMLSAFESVLDSLSAAAADASSQSGNLSLPSSARFGGQGSGGTTNNRPAYQQRGVPVQAHPLLSDILYLKGRISTALGNYTEAKELYDGALGMLTTLFPKPSLKKLCVSYELANLTFYRGNIEESRVLHTSLLQQRLQLCDEDHPDKADSLFMIAVLNNLLSKYDDSTQILTEALSSRKKLYGEMHWKIAEVYAECALVLHAKGFHADSDALYEKAAIITRRCFGDVHLLLTSIYLGQAANARECGLYEQAKATVDQAVTMRGMLLGETHSGFAQCLYEQALVMRCLGKILEVKRLLDTAIAIQRERLGKYHPCTAMTLLTMGINFMDLAKYTTATHVYNRALQLIKKSFGSDHVLIAYGLTGMAENSRCQGFFDEARSTHEQALYLRRKLLGERHHSIAESTYYLGEVYLTLAKYEDAMKCFDDALALQRMALGQTHPVIATTTHGIAKVLLAQGKVFDAKSMHDRAYSMRRHCLAGDHPDIGDSQYCNALVFLKLGKYDQAGALFERCLVTVRDARGARHPLVASILYNSGLIANYMARYKQSEALLLESLHIRLTVYRDVNENHPEIAETYFGLAENLRCRGKYDFIDEKERNPPEVKKVLKNLPKLAQSTGSVQAPYERSIASVQEGYDVAEAILDGNRPNTDPNASSSGGNSASNSNNKSNQEGDNNISTRAVQSAPSPTAEAKFNPLQDDMTAPTVGISAIENTHPVGDAESVVADDHSIPEQVLDHRTMTDNPAVYQALPMYKRVLAHLTAVFPDNHPTVLTAQYAIAETSRLMGKYDLALENHQDILEVRRKVIGDNHPDTVLSMLAIGESLLGLGRIYPETASGSVDAKQVRMAKQAISLGVSLLDHLSSLIAPVETEGTLQPLPSSASGNRLLDDVSVSPRRPNTTVGSRAATANTTASRGKHPAEENWDFISKPDIAKKKKEVLKLPKGYMGYQFPALKKITRTETNTATRPKKVRTADAKWLYDNALTIQKRLYGDTVEQPTTASALYAKGELLRQRGDNSGALQLLDASLVMRRKLFRGTHPCIADCINSMAEIFRVENKFKQALPMYDKALEIRMEAFECSHPRIAEIKNNLATLYFAEGKLTEAQALFQEALQLCETLLGCSHPYTANVLINLANILQSSGQNIQALTLYQRSFAIKQLIYGAEHIEVASLLNNIGLVYKSLHQYTEAEDSYMKALDIQRKLYGTTHKDIAATLNNLASLFVSQNKRHEAKEFYKDSISMRTALYGIDHPTVAATLNNYAGLLFSLGEHEQAKDYFESALTIRKKIYGENHYTVAETLNNIALLLYTQGQVKEAILLYERSLEIKRACYGELNPSVATSYYNIATLYHKSGHFDKAVLYYKSAYEIRHTVLGEVHDDTLAVEESLKTVEKEKAKYLALYKAKMKESRNINNSNSGGGINKQHSITTTNTTNSYSGGSNNNSNNSSSIQRK